MESIRSLITLTGDDCLPHIRQPDVDQISRVLVQEWQTNPWLLERNLPPWISLHRNRIGDDVCLTVDKFQNPNSWLRTRQMCHDFWFALDILVFYRSAYSHEAIYISPERDHIYFPGISTYAQRLSKAMVNNSEFLIPDLRHIVASYLHFI